jgi:hypothetical protein
MQEENSEKISIVTYCLGFYFMLMVFDSIPMFGIGSLLRLLVILPVGAILFIKMRSRLQINSMTVMFTVYCLFLLFSYMYSINRTETFNQVKRIILNLVIILTAGGMYDYNSREIDFLKKSLMAGGVLTVLLTLMMADYSSSGRLTLSVNGTVQDQNYLNGYIFFAFIYFLDGFLERKRVMMLLPVLGIMVFTLMTGSRGAMVALFGIALVQVLCLLLKEGRLRISTLAMIAAGILLVVFLYRPILSLLPESVAVRFTPEYIAEHGSTGRSEIWKYLLGRFRDSTVFRTLFGYGFGTVAYLNEYNHLVAHNLWIEHLLAVGVIGECIFVTMQMTFIRGAWKTHDAYVISAYAGYLIMMMSLSLLTYKPVWNCMIMILIVSRYHRNSKALSAEVL